MDNREGGLYRKGEIEWAGEERGEFGWRKGKRRIT